MPTHEPSPNEHPHPASSGNGLSILVIEDHVDTGYWISRALEGEGYSVRWERRGEHGLLALSDGPPPGAVILDLMLPGMKGDLIHDVMRQSPDHQRTPILIITAMADDELPPWRQDPNVACLTKPVSKQVILSTLARLLGR